MAEEEQPKNVKELLVELKDASELMVDLAYAAVFFNEEDLAEEVEELESRMDGHLRRLREVAMLAARSPEDAEAMAGVLHIAAAIEKIGDAASDTARVIQAKLGIPDALRPDLRHADEIVGRVKVRDGSPAVGRSLREVATLEGRSDVLHDQLESWVLKAAPEARRPEELRGLLRLAYASETIFDAARDMTWLVEQGEELHPVVALALEESEEVATETIVEEGSHAAGRSPKDLQP